MKLKVQSFQNLLFYISYIFILAFSFLGHIDGIGGYLNVLSKIAILLLLLLIIFQMNSYKKKEVFIWLILVLFALFTVFCSSDYSLLKIVMIIFCMKGLNLTRIVKFDLIVRLILITMVFILLKLGICSDVMSYSDGFYKHSLGFTNPNALGMHSFIVCLEFMYLNWHKMSVFKYLVLIIPICILNNYIGCRSTFVIFGLFIILKIIFDHTEKFFNNNFLKFVIKNSFILMFLLTFLFYFLYESGTSIGIEVNKILSNRLYNADFFYSKFDLSLFGRNLESGLTFDTFYAHSVLGYGIINTILILWSTRALFEKFYSVKAYNLILIFFIFSIYGLTERIWFLVDYNVFITFFSLIIFADKNLELKDDYE